MPRNEKHFTRKSNISQLTSKKKCSGRWIRTTECKSLDILFLSEKKYYHLSVWHFILSSHDRSTILFSISSSRAPAKTQPGRNWDKTFLNTPSHLLEMKVERGREVCWVFLPAIILKNLSKLVWCTDAVIVKLNNLPNSVKGSRPDPLVPPSFPCRVDPVQSSVQTVLHMTVTSSLWVSQ